MPERLHAKEDIKPKAAGNVPLLVGRDSPKVVDADGKYVQATATRKGEAYVKLAAEDEAADGTEYEASNAPSPLTSVSTTAANHKIDIPVGAKDLYLLGEAAFRYGDNSVLDGTAGEGYFYQSAFVESRPIPCADKVSIYVRIHASSGTTTVYFRFDDKD